MLYSVRGAMGTEEVIALLHGQTTCKDLRLNFIVYGTYCATDVAEYVTISANSFEDVKAIMERCVLL